MLPQFRAASIFDSEDPTLDPMAIQHALPPKDRFAPTLVTGLILGSFLFVAVLWPGLLTARPPVKQARGALPQSVHRVDVVLTPAVPPPPRPAALLLPTGQGPGSGGPDRAGSGGSGFMDPFFLEAPRPSALDLAEVPAGVETLAVPAAPPDPNLPLRAGGDGRSRGRGPGSGGGYGGGMGPGGIRPQAPSPRGPRVLREVRPTYTLRPVDLIQEAVVSVEITLAADGRVASARAVRGPGFLHRNAVEAALQWRFEPLSQAGLQAPQSLTIHFHYSTHHR